VYVASMGAWLDVRILLGTVLKIVGVPFDVTRHWLRLPGVAPHSPVDEVPAGCEEEAVFPIPTPASQSSLSVSS
jgi:hypothetical protein